jgi:transposase
MLTMAQVNSIREMFFEKGMTYAQLARVTGYDVKTIKRYILKNDFNQPETKKGNKRCSKLDQYKATIDKWLEADKLGNKKQRHTAQAVFNRLSKIHGTDFDCSYRLIALYVAEHKKELYKTDKQFYLPLEHIKGEAQFDFGTADFFERNVRCKGHYVNLSFPHSNAGYTQLFKGENMQCLAEGLINIFNNIGFVPNNIWFDNLTPAVKKILKNHNRELTDSFYAFQKSLRF